MGISFDPDEYRAALQTLLERQGVAITVKAFNPERAWEKLQDGPIAELMIEDAQFSQTGAPRELDVALSAGLLVLYKLNEDEAEEKAFVLALEVSTSLIDEQPDGEPPVFEGGPIIARGVEPESPDGALANRVVAWLVRFDHAFRVRRLNTITEPAQPTGLYLGRKPNVGEGHEGDYKKIWPRED